MAGGVALNCSANGVIHRSRLFDQFSIQPAAGDDGAALGAALYTQARQASGLAPLTPRLPLWGPEFSSESVQSTLNANTATQHRACPSDDALVSETAKRLAAGQIVGWFQGRMEFGPRALGHRSILADPRDPEMQPRINRRIKHREDFRPFAPAVTAEQASEYFEILDGAADLFASMLTTARVRAEHRHRLPAVTHVDGTARVQIVSRTELPLFWSLITKFGRRTGVPVLLNTSFNVAEEPIVCTPDDAVRTFLTSRLDTLVIDRFLVERCQTQVTEHAFTKAKDGHEQLADGNGDTQALPSQQKCVHRVSHGERMDGSDPCVHELFQQQAALHPQVTAVKAGSTEISYGELESSSNRLAHELRDLGIREESLVGICLDRSPEFALAALAVVKAGGAYVPIDPTEPAARRRSLMLQAEVELVLTRDDLVDCFADLRCRMIDGQQRSRPIAARYDLPPETRLRKDNAAYVIFTSGTSGAPKGVVVEHRNLVNLVAWHHKAYPLSPGECVGQTSGISFDASAWELWAALTSGASLHVIDDETRALPETLADWCDQHKIVSCFLATRLAENSLLVITRKPSRLRYLLTGGEQLHAAAVDSAASVRLINHYGVTEATVVTTAGDVTDEVTRPVPTIGRPISNTQVYLLDERAELVPPGAIGELFIAGNGVARGYRLQPRATAERFVPDPFSKIAGARLYRSGDLARYCDDGSLEYIGRVDRQVQLRGLRIEPEEIEKMLGTHPDVKQTAVLTRQERDRPTQLAAFVVPSRPNVQTLDPTGESLEARLREFLLQRLPAAMIPTHIIVLAALPTTTRGKTDFSQLAEFADHSPDRSGKATSPSRIAETLAIVWREVLGVAHVGAHDNFFQLGGDSILAIQCVARGRSMGIELSPEQFVRHPTIAELAELTQAAATRPHVPTVKKSFKVQSCGGPTPLTPIQHWYFDASGAHANQFTQTMQFEVRQSFSDDRWSGALRSLVDHHHSLRLRFHVASDERTQKVAATEDHELFWSVDLRAAEGDDVEQFSETLIAEMRSRIDLERGPLLQAVRMRMSNGQHDQLILLIHHCVVDAVSWQILLEDLQRLLQSSDLDAAEFPAVTCDFTQWAATLDELAQAGARDRELDDWLDQLPATAKPLPRDIVDAPVMGRGEFQRTISLSLDPETTQLLLSASIQKQATRPLARLAAAVATVVADWVQTPEILLELESHGRYSDWAGLDVSRTVGWFTAGYPLRIPFVRGQPLRELAHVIDQQCWNVPGGGLGYGILRHGGLERVELATLRSRPRPDIRLNYLGRLDQLFSGSPLFRLLHRPIAPHRGPSELRPHAFEIDAFVLDRQLHIDWTFGTDLHKPETAKRLADHFASTLRRLATDDAQQERGYHSPHFDGVSLTPSEIEDLAQELRQWND